MKIVMAVDTLVTIEVPKELLEKFKAVDFDINSLNSKDWELLNNLTTDRFREHYPNYHDLEFVYHEQIVE